MDAAGVPACVKQLSFLVLVGALNIKMKKKLLSNNFVLSVFFFLSISTVLMFEFSLGVASPSCRKSCSGLVSWFCVKQTHNSTSNSLMVNKHYWPKV